MNDTQRDDLPFLRHGENVASAPRGGTQLYSPSWYVPGGRLCLTSGTPVQIGDLLAQTTLFYTPFNHDQIALWTNGVWILQRFTEVQLLASTLAASKMYDVYVWWNPDTYAIQLEVGTAWTNDTTRADAVPVQLNGVYVKSVAAASRRWVGIVRTTTATKFVSAASATATAGRWVCNGYNKLPMHVVSTDSSTRTTVSTTFVQVGAVQVDFICDGTTPFHLIGTTGSDATNNATRAGAITIGSSTTAADTNSVTASCFSNTLQNSDQLTTTDTNILAAGRYQRFLLFKTSNPAANMYADGATGAATGRTAPATGLMGTVYG